MQVTSETVAPREVVLTITPDPETIDRAMRQAAREISRVRPLRGYRPGRAPYALVERTYGRELLLNQALEDIAPEIYREAIKEADIQPYEQGKLDIESQDPLVLKVNVPLNPTIELGPYAEMTIEPADAVSISDADVDEQIEMLRRQHAEVKAVSRPLQMGDQVDAAIFGSVDGEEVQHDEKAVLDLTEFLKPAGFAEALLGARMNDLREFSLTYPEDEENEKLAGKKVEYRVAVGEVREVVPPEADDSFAKTVGDYETLDALREAIAADLQRQHEAQARAKERLEAVEMLIAASQVEYPQAALEREIDRAIANQRAYAQRLGFSLDSYLRVTNRTEQNLRDEIRDEAVKGLLQRLVLLEYIRKEGVHLTDEEGNNAINAYANNIARSYGDKADEILKQAVQNGALSLAIEDAMVMKAAQYLADRMAGRPLPVEDESTEDEHAGHDHAAHDHAAHGHGAHDHAAHEDADEAVAETDSDADAGSADAAVGTGSADSASDAVEQA
ncbi:MAG: trigger factor [Anaerolineae bacterium]